MTNTAIADLVGRVLAGRYRLLAPVGAGASGRVLLADDVRLRRRVAVKVLHTGLAEDAGFLRRFRAEAQMAAALHHPHVMAVYDWGEDEGVPFMVVELLKGGSLRGLLDTGARLSPAQVAHVGRQVAAALRYAHDRGLVHRDIKPANLLFDEHGIVRVGDFGLARALAEASWTEPGTVVGTARYAAPEQASGSSVDGRADLYALAVVLVEAATGEVPLVGETAISTLAARASTSIEPPGELGPLAPVIARAGHIKPAERFADAGAMGAALAAAGRALPAPAPLPLAGLGDVADVEPTRIPTTRVFDQDAAPPGPDATITDDDAVPLAIPVETSSRTRGSAIPVVVAAAVVGILAAVGALVLGSGSGATVGVPSLVGLPQSEALTRATDAGLTMTVVEQRRSDDPAGLVIEQRPGPGDFLGEGDEIEVVVSRGPPPIALPDVAGKPLAEAQGLLEAEGFVVAVERRFDETVVKDIALGTDPAAGGKAPRESQIKLIVSDGPAPVPVPDVAGKTFDEAAAILKTKRLGAVQGDAFSDTVPAGTVIGTDPAVGQPAARDSQVTVIVSKGPELVAVPNVVGKSVEAASQSLAAVGLTPDVQNYGPGKPVRAQDPPAGTQVKKGSKVTLFL